MPPLRAALVLTRGDAVFASLGYAGSAALDPHYNSLRCHSEEKSDEESAFTIG